VDKRVVVIEVLAPPNVFDWYAFLEMGSQEGLAFGVEIGCMHDEESLRKFHTV
jgi:hypothetical protein